MFREPATRRRKLVAIAILFALGAYFSAYSGAGGDTARASTQAASRSDSAGMIAQNLMKFDTLDFVSFNPQHLDRFKESHAEDITVTFPHGHETHGLAPHIEDMKVQTADSWPCQRVSDSLSAQSNASFACPG